MAVFSSLKAELPERKYTPRPSPWDSNYDFQALQAAIAQGKMKPKEQKGMHIEAAAMAKKLGMNDPVRSAYNTMRKWIRKMGLESDYYCGRYETNSPGVWVLTITYDPPQTAMRVPPRQRPEERV